MRSGDPPDVHHRHILARSRRGPLFVCPHPIPAPTHHSTTTSTRGRGPWLWTPPFMPLFWTYAAMALLQSSLAVRRYHYAVHRRWIVRLNAVFLGATLGRPVVTRAVVLLVSVSDKPLQSSPPPVLTDGAISGTRPESGTEDLDFCWAYWNTRCPT